jgi:hypothetical protein
MTTNFRFPYRMYRTPPSARKKRNKSRRRAGNFGSGGSDPHQLAESLASKQLLEARRYITAAKILWKERRFLVRVFEKKENASKARIKASVNRSNQSYGQIRTCYAGYILQFKRDRSIGYFDLQLLTGLYERIQTLEQALMVQPEAYANLELTSIDSGSEISHFGSYHSEDHQDPGALQLGSGLPTGTTRFTEISN